MKLYTEISHLIKTFAGQANTLTIPAPYIGYTRSLECALLLSQCIYWSDRTKDPDGWFYKTYDEWKEEIYLPEYKVRKYSRQLQEKGVLEIKVKKVNGTPTLHFRINPEKFSESFLEFLQNGDSKASRMETAKFKESKLENLQFQKLENLQFLSLSTKPTTEPTLIKSADEKENLASLRSEPEQLHLKTPVTDQAQEISQGHSRDLVLDQSSAPANFPQKKEFYGGQRLNDRLNNAYPWRTCDRDTFKRFCAFVGNQLPRDAMAPERKGFAHIRNNEAKGDIERNEFDWEAFNEAEARRVVNAEAIAPLPAEPSIQQFHQPAEPEVSDCDMIQARINAAITFGQRVNPVTLQRAKELGIDVSALESPAISAPAPEPAIAPVRSTPTFVNSNFELGDWEDAI